jgi:flagellar biosynthetic protein FlhB
MESSSQDRNLPASEQKLQKARKDGQVARSKDMSHLAVLGAGGLGLLAIMPTLAERLKIALSQQLVFNAAVMNQPNILLNRLEDMTLIGLAACAAFAAIVITASVSSTLAIGGWVLSFKPVMPDFSRINPLAGFGRLFSKEHVAEIVKLVVISSLIVTTGGMFLINSLQEISALMLQPSTMALAHLASWLTSGLAMMLLVVAVVAGIDVPLQIFMHKSRLKMSHEEVKQENKESNGNPHIKGRQRQRQREIAQRNSVSAVPKADFVVMNPTHYAVALKYDEKSMGAPQVIAKGADLLAFKIREVAKNHAIPVLQSPVLARALYAHAELDREIPAPLFGAVAQVLAYVYRVKAAMRGEGPMPDLQPEPFVPQELDPLNTPPGTAKKKRATR